MKKKDTSPSKPPIKKENSNVSQRPPNVAANLKSETHKPVNNWKGVQNKTSFLNSVNSKFNPKTTGINRQDSSKSGDNSMQLIPLNSGNEDFNQKITRFKAKIENEKTTVVDKFKRLMMQSDSHVRNVVQSTSNLTSNKSQLFVAPVSPNIQNGLNRQPTNLNQLISANTLDQDPQQADIEVIFRQMIKFYESEVNLSLLNNSFHSMEMLLAQNPENLSLKFDKAVKVYLFQLIAKNQAQFYLGADQVIKKANFGPYFHTKKMDKVLEEQRKIFNSDSKDYIDELSLAHFLE